MTIGFGDFVPGNSYIYNTSEAVDQVIGLQEYWSTTKPRNRLLSIFQEEGNAKLVLGSIYILLGIAIIAMCFNLVHEKVSTQVTPYRWPHFFFIFNHFLRFSTAVGY